MIVRQRDGRPVTSGITAGFSNLSEQPVEIPGADDQKKRMTPETDAIRSYRNFRQKTARPESPGN